MPKLKALLELALITGARIGELLTLRYGGLPGRLFDNEKRQAKLPLSSRILVDDTRLELVTSALRTRRSPN